MIANTSNINPALLQPKKEGPGGINEAASRLDSKTLKKIDDTALEFEAMFLTEMMKPMFEGLEVDKTFGGGKGEEVFRDFAMVEYGKNMAKSSSLGIADMVRDQMIRLQSANLPTTNSPAAPQDSINPLQNSMMEMTNDLSNDLY